MANIQTILNQSGDVRVAKIIEGDSNTQADKNIFTKLLAEAKDSTKDKAEPLILNIEDPKIVKKIDQTKKTDQINEGDQAKKQICLPFY